jgi:hypothetical protein
VCVNTVPLIVVALPAVRPMFEFAPVVPMFEFAPLRAIVKVVLGAPWAFMPMFEFEPLMPLALAPCELKRIP